MNLKGTVFTRKPYIVEQNDIVFVPDVIERVAHKWYDDTGRDEPHYYFEGDPDYDFFLEEDVCWCSRNDTPEELVAILYEGGCRNVYRNGDYVEIASAFAWREDKPKVQGRWIGSYAFLEIFPDIPDKEIVPLLSLVPQYKPKYAEGELVYDAERCRIGIVGKLNEASPGIFSYQLLGEDDWTAENHIVWGSAQIERYTLPQALKDQYFKYNAGIGWRRGEDTIKVLPI